MELSAYAGIPHLLTPIITDPKKAAQALEWWSRRWTRATTTRSSSDSATSRTSTKAVRAGKVRAPAGSNRVAPYPYLLVVVDEMADLMMVAKNDVESSIQRITQLACRGRAPGARHAAPVGRRGHRPDQGEHPVPTGIRQILRHRFASHPSIRWAPRLLIGQGDALFLA